MRHLGDLCFYAFLISAFYSTCFKPAMGSQISPFKSINVTNSDLQRLSYNEADKLIKNLKIFNQLDRTIIYADFIYNGKDSLNKKVAEGIILSVRLGKNDFKRIFISEEASENWVEYIICSGDKNEVWFRNSESKKFISVESDKWEQNFFETVLFRPVDLMLPNIFSLDYNYEGPRIYGLRSIVHSFIVKLNNGIIDDENDLISSFRVLIDDKYNGIRKIEYLRNAEVVNSLEVLGLKKINNKWVISRLVSNFKGHKTLLKVKEVRIFDSKNVGDFFDPFNLRLETLNEL